MTRKIKRVAAIHDLSGFGRASLSVIIPILSKMGIQVCPIPTAILSTHTGGFKNYSMIDLTDRMEEYIDHWRRLGIEFDCIYSGFLGSSKQIDIVSNFIDVFSSNDPLIVVDPVLGDNGFLYSAVSESMIEKMGHLIKKADIITPNFTEAAYLLDRSYDLKLPEETIKKWLLRLSEKGPTIPIITSVFDEDFPGEIEVMAYNSKEHVFLKMVSEYIPAHYPGVGDIFTSIIVGSVLGGDELSSSISKAMQFITDVIMVSHREKYPEREGVFLEAMLDKL